MTLPPVLEVRTHLSHITDLSKQHPIWQRSKNGQRLLDRIIGISSSLSYYQSEYDKAVAQERDTSVIIKQCENLAVSAQKELELAREQVVSEERQARSEIAEFLYNDNYPDGFIAPLGINEDALEDSHKDEYYKDAHELVETLYEVTKGFQNPRVTTGDRGQLLRDFCTLKDAFYKKWKNKDLL